MLNLTPHAIAIRNTQTGEIKPAPSYKELASAFIELADGLSSADIIHMTGIPNNKADFIIDVFYRLIENMDTGNENLCSSKNPVG